MRAAYHSWPRHPHPIEVETRTSEETVAATSLLNPKEALDSTLDEDDEDDDDDGEVLPVPMVNVTRMLDDDDDDDDDNHDHDLLSYMEVSQIAIPDPTFHDDFISVVRRSSQARSSSNSVRLSQTTMTNDTLALQQAVIQANRETQEADCIAIAESQAANCRAIKHDVKSDKLSKPEYFHWWLDQIWGRLCLDHEAWDGILDEGKPHTPTSENRTLSNKLVQHLNACMTATVGDAVVGLTVTLEKAWKCSRPSSTTSFRRPSKIFQASSESGTSSIRKRTNLPWCSATESPSLRSMANALDKSLPKAAKSLPSSMVSTKVSAISPRTASQVVSLRRCDLARYDRTGQNP
jgi:hypothetical protein